jgi:predicted acyltransferase
MKEQIKRNNSLDSLRGIAILLMVLSSSIAFAILPGWMYHAQVPPPSHQFNPDAAGITWVDLVFPFFLFSMGAAIPLSMRKKIQSGTSRATLLSIVKRAFLLVFFASFTFHARAWVLSDQPEVPTYLLSILCFFLLFAIYGEFGAWLNKVQSNFVKLLGMLIAIAVMAFGFSGTKSFDIHKTDIIMLVLANMAFFGTIIWWLTFKNVWLRIGILPIVMAVFLAAKEPGSINEIIFNWTPAVWLYKFYYLKYLFIILPATLAGEWIIEEQKETSNELKNKQLYVISALISFALIVINVICLYTRHVELNFIINGLLIATLLLVISKVKKLDGRNLVVKMAYLGGYLLLLGLLFEAFEGGIKKDYSTYSYYFVCTGLAFLAMVFFYVLERFNILHHLTNTLAMVGKNPMIAYTAGNLLLIPILRMTRTEEYLNHLNNGFLQGLLRGVIFTTIVALITIWATKKRIFWKT